MKGTWHARYEWELTRVEDVGQVALPDGVLAIGDVAWSFEGIPVQIDVGVGVYTMRRAIARTTEPLADGRVPQDNAAVAMLVAPAERVERWERVPPSHFVDRSGGFWTEVGIIGYGAPATLNPALVYSDERIFDQVFGHVRDDGWLALTAEQGDLVCFSVGPQHQECRTWKAVSAVGSVVAVLTDLGLLDLDPVVQPPTWL